MASRPTFADMTVDCLAAYRLTRFLQRDTFPPVRKARERVMDKGPDWTVELVECPWCLGAYVSALVVAARLLAPRLWPPLAGGLAVSAAVGLLLSQVDPPE